MVLYRTESVSGCLGIGVTLIPFRAVTYILDSDWGHLEGEASASA
jgi:hypothetical protein